MLPSRKAAANPALPGIPSRPVGIIARVSSLLRPSRLPTPAHPWADRRIKRIPGSIMQPGDAALRLITRSQEHVQSERCSYVCQGLKWHSLASFEGLLAGGPAGYCWVADKTGMGARDGAQALMRSRPAGQMRPGTAGGSFAGQQVRGSRISGQAVPGAFGRYPAAGRKWRYTSRAT